MYLLMLLATFMSAIYGYNLSARPDYDRDVARKKAMAIIYKFSFQHDVIRRLALAINRSEHTDKGLEWVLPGDMFYSIYDDEDGAEDIHTVFKQDDTETVFYLREKDKNDNTLTGGEDLLVSGRHLYDGSEMASKVLCVDLPMNETASRECEPEVDGEGNITGTCCGKTVGGRYLVSYKKLDARWINRLSGELSYDFWRALNKKQYYDCIGIIRWVNGSWQFKGKINFLPVYKDDWDQWMVDYGTDVSYPKEHRERVSWTLPNWIFTRNYFKSKGSLGEGNICDDGCIFKIQSF